jgi:TPR repeat protein
MRRKPVKITTLVVAVALATALNGCVGVAVKGAKYANGQATIAGSEAAAARGDAKAQYELGDAYCCSVGSVDLTHDTIKATSWFCRAARQGYMPAQYRLGRLYSGHPVEGLDVQQRAKLLVAGAPENKPLALMWLTLAARNGDKEATAALTELTRAMSGQEQETGQRYLADWQNAPCEWEQVFVAK